MKTVFITGASSGIGKETAMLFLANGWNVIAAMRGLLDESEINKHHNMLQIKCDVTAQQSIENAVTQGINHFGSIDVLVNNAGYYTLGPFEAATQEQINKQIATNLLGVISVTREMIPHFRKQRSGTIINISSIAGVTTIPLQSLYHATKWGVEGFSESLQYELRPFQIRIKIIEPGVIKTDFYGRSMSLLQNDKLTDYSEYSRKVIQNILNNAKHGSDPRGVAQTIYTAASDNKTKLRYPTGNSKNMAAISSIMPRNLFRFIIRNVMER